MQSIGSKDVFNNFYRKELDQQIRSNILRRFQDKEALQLQRQKYNEKLTDELFQGRAKDQAYKNYYSRIAEQQEKRGDKFQSYDSEKVRRASDHIQKALQKFTEMDRLQHSRRVKIDELAKSNYKSELQSQLQKKNFDKFVAAKQHQKFKQFFKKNSYSPKQLQQLDRDQRMHQRMAYKEKLDEAIQAKQGQNSPKPKESFYAVIADHNPIVNPLPYSVQNPYILKQVNQSKMANAGNALLDGHKK